MEKHPLARPKCDRPDQQRKFMSAGLKGFSAQEARERKERYRHPVVLADL